MALIVTDALKFRESENDQFRRLSLSANFNTPVPVSQGGTGATTAAQAAKNLNVLPLGEVVTKIPENADLNDYTIPGVYAVSKNDIARTIANMPEGYAGTLRVFSGLGADITASSTYKYIIQEYVAYYGRTYYRYGDSGSGTTLTWGAWRTVYDSRDFPLSVTKGGTGASSAAAARANLGVPTLLDVYPVGSIYMSVNSASPATLFGGTWEQLKDRFLLAAGSTYSAGGTGGSATMAHTHTISHTHNLDPDGYAKIVLYSSGGDVSYREKSGVTAWTANFRVTGSGGAGSSTSLGSTYGAELGGRTAGSSAANTGAASNTDNMPPYLTVYMWKRTK